MTKDSYNYFIEKGTNFLQKARLFYVLFISIFITLVALMFIYQIYSYFVTLIIIIIVMYFLYRFVFVDYIYFVNNYNNIQRIKLMKNFELSDEVLEYFSGEVFKQLYDDDYIILHKNDVYVLARNSMEGTIYDIGVAVYQLDNSTSEVSPTTRELSNELSGYLGNSSVIKVVILVRDKFDEDELEALEYDSSMHKNTVVIGIEKSTSKLIYNYFLNGKNLDIYLGKLFQVDLVREQ